MYGYCWEKIDVRHYWDYSLNLPSDKWQRGHMCLKWIKRIKNELLTWSKNGNCTKKLAEIELFTKDFLDIFLPRDWESLNKQNLFRKAQWYSLGKEQQFIMWTLLTLINVVIIKRFHSRGHKLCNFIGTNKESFYIKLRPTKTCNLFSNIRAIYTRTRLK